MANRAGSLTLAQVFEALRERGRHQEAVKYENMVRQHLAEDLSDDLFYDLTIDEAAFLMHLDTLLASKNKEDNKTALELIYKVEKLANYTNKKGKCYESLQEYVEDLQHRDFCYSHLR